MNHVAALGVAALCAPSVPAGPAAAVAPLLDEPAAVVLLERAAERSLQPQDLYAWLETQGEGAVAELFERLGRPPWSERHLNGVREQLAQVPAGIVPMLQTRGLAEPIETRARLIGLRIIALAPTANALELAFALTAPKAETLSVADVLDEPLTRALEAALERAPSRAPERLTQFALEGVPLQQLAAVRALGGQSTALAFKSLAQLLGATPALDALILAQLGRIASQVEVAPAAPLASHLRAYSRSSNPALRREATLLLGRLVDIDAIPLLIEMLTDSDERASCNAHWALGNITRRTFRNDPQLWASWFAAEGAWWESRGSELLAALSDPRAGKVVAAINELATHRVYRRQIAEHLMPLLDNPSVEIVGLTCSALATLEAKNAVAHLTRLLVEDDADLAGPAQAALQSITGLSPERDPEAWQSLLATP